MTGPRIGSLCTGYRGLDMAVQQVLGGEVVWHCQYDPDDPHQYAARILAHHCPDVPNHGDITAVDWSAVEPVDVLTAGFPCQDVSLAGKRAGLAEGTRSGLWLHVARAIEFLQPRLVVIENVRGLLSTEAHSDVEPCPWCVGDGGGEPALRALGAVLGDLADLGFDAEWSGVTASAVGAPHERFRVVVAACPADTAGEGREGPHGWHWRPGAAGNGGGAAHADDVRGDRAGRPARVPERHAAGEDRGTAHAEGEGLETRREGRRRGRPAEDADGATGGERRIAAPGQAPGGGARADAGGRVGTPAADTDSHAVRHESVAQSGRGGTALAAHADSVPTADTAGDRWGEGRAEPARQQRGPDASLGSSADWGRYAAAVDRWEHVLGRPAPPPTEPTGRDGAHRLSPAFVEWMMGLPGGHVTGVPGLTRAAQLKALGNGVVPQQVAAALPGLLDRLAADMPSGGVS